MILKHTQALLIALDGPALSSECDLLASWSDTELSPASLTPGSRDGLSEGSHEMPIVAAPAVGFLRKIKYVSIFNADIVSHTVTVMVDDSGVMFTILTPTLGVFERAEYVEGIGWRTFTALGEVKGIGPTGPVGAVGAQGSPGPIGGDGDEGPRGPPGPPGPQGDKGDAGPAGGKGTTGDPGATGATGANGPPGFDGTDGDRGPIGPPGTTGATGASGVDGAAGAQGMLGPPGTDGQDGLDGVQGPIGLTGATGAAGANGVDGATGATGTQGPPSSDFDDRDPIGAPFPIGGSSKLDLASGVAGVLPEANGGTGTTGSHIEQEDFYTTGATAAGSSVRGAINSTDNNLAIQIPSGKTLKVLDGRGHAKSGAVAGTYTIDIILYDNGAGSIVGVIATNTGAAATVIYCAATPGTRAAPILTLAGPTTALVGYRNNVSSPGVLDVTWKHRARMLYIIE